MNPALVIHPEVAEALVENTPIVALESTIISHGMPFPRNIETAHQIESAVRQAGAIPATIALIAGAAHVGLTEPSLGRLAKESGVAKVSRRDVGAILASGQTGATTVATTMLIAHRAGIRVFATGGIGGVHRGIGTTLDISADITELGHTPVAVVCAGAKSILDLPNTLEALETAGVPVVGYQTDEFPAFFSRGSGLAVSVRLDTPAGIAAMLDAHWGFGMNAGVVVANPISEDDALPLADVDRIVAEALVAAETQGVTGKDITPFLLAYLNDSSGGATLQANIALVLSNATLAAQIAAELSQTGHRQ
ncbi:Pseudouridine 5'-phosphate glycosidase [hydrothermal vent metagenome]|uniref:Pseudouridine 5'-phosphate glycosidase n=1 Tax=hydrothermal vent metagenome TaxID=652676 RepID=A0A3B0TBB7_9ZZZZ